MTRVVASIEARMNSSRLPGKVLEDVCSKPALSRLYDRLRQSRRIDDVVIATTTNREDDMLALWAEVNGVLCYRGSEDDVLGRVVSAHSLAKSEVIVEVTGDCPLLDPELLDLGIETFFANNCDVVTNCKVSSYPQGVDVQVFAFRELEWVCNNINDAAVREHVSLYFYENPELYRIINLMAPLSLQSPCTRLQLDYPEDLRVIQAIYSYFDEQGVSDFSTLDVLCFLSKNPDIAQINADCIEKPTR